MGYTLSEHFEILCQETSSSNWPWPSGESRAAVSQWEQGVVCLQPVSSFDKLGLYINKRSKTSQRRGTDPSGMRVLVTIVGKVGRTCGGDSWGYEEHKIDGGGGRHKKLLWSWDELQQGSIPPSHPPFLNFPWKGGPSQSWIPSSQTRFSQRWIKVTQGWILVNPLLLPLRQKESLSQLLRVLLADSPWISPCCELAPLKSDLFQIHVLSWNRPHPMTNPVGVGIFLLLPQLGITLNGLLNFYAPHGLSETSSETASPLKFYFGLTLHLFLPLHRFWSYEHFLIDFLHGILYLRVCALGNLTHTSLLIVLLATLSLPCPQSMVQAAAIVYCYLK